MIFLRSTGQFMTSDVTQDPFAKELIEEIIPFVQSRYRTPANPENRALSGLSMGGIQTLNIGLHHLDTFRYVAVFWWGWGQTDIARANGPAVIDKFKKRRRED
jgi:enterochelin esterase-like enzyme